VAVESPRGRVQDGSAQQKAAAKSGLGAGWQRLSKLIKNGRHAKQTSISQDDESSSYDLNGMLAVCPGHYEYRDAGWNAMVGFIGCGQTIVECGASSGTFTCDGFRKIKPQGASQVSAH